jgi:HD-like signal output (HDOD) protein
LVQKGAFPEARESAFIGGLLHDLGKPFLWIHQAKPYQEVIWAVMESGRETHEAEQQLLGMHHGEIGGELARWWKLPEMVQVAIACHHEQSQIPQAALLVQVADYIAHRAGFADGLRPEGSLPVVSRAWLMDTKAQLIKDLVEEVAGQPQELQEVVHLLQST